MTEPQTPDEFDELHKKNVEAIESWRLVQEANRQRKFSYSQNPEHVTAQDEAYEATKREFLEWLDEVTNRETAKFALIIEQLNDVRRATEQGLQTFETMAAAVDHYNEENQ